MASVTVAVTYLAYIRVYVSSFRLHYLEKRKSGLTPDFDGSATRMEIHALCDRSLFQCSRSVMLE